MDVEQVIREYLPDVLHMSLATCIGNKPWVCEVHFVYDGELNLYFRSKTSRRHSQEITKNQNVAGNIVAQHGKDEKPRAVYFEGRAKEQDSPDKSIFELFKSRLGLSDDIVADSKKKDGHKVYKIAVSDYYLFDARESVPSQKYHLAWNSQK